MVSYNLQFFEPHGRQLTDPWSCRQSAIHQKFLLSENRSAWVVIHQPLLFHDSLQDAQVGVLTHPMSLHIRYIRSATHYWRDYLKYRSSELLSFDAKLSIPKPFNEFETGFAISQNITTIRGKLHQTISILDGMLEILIKLSNHAEAMGEWMRLSSSSRSMFQAELEQISNEMKSHRSVTNSLIRRSEDLRLTNEHIIALKNQDILIKNGVSLARLAQLGAADNRVMVRMADKTRQDSRTMRIATIVAIVYLPANLVTSFFTTNFVDFNSAGPASASISNGSIKINSHVWIAVLSSLCLAIVTMATITIWDRCGRDCCEAMASPRSDQRDSGDSA